MKSRTERKESERVASRCHRHFWTGGKTFNQWKCGSTFQRYDKGSPEKGNLPQYYPKWSLQLGRILIIWQLVRNADLGAYWICISKSESRKSVFLMHAKIWAAPCYSFLPMYHFLSVLEVLQVLGRHIHLGCQAISPGTLSTHHSLAPRPVALDHGMTIALCNYSTTGWGVSTAGSVRERLASCMWRHQLEEITTHISLWHMKKNRLWLWKFLYVEPLSNTFSMKWKTGGVL